MLFVKVTLPMIRQIYMVVGPCPVREVHSMALGHPHLQQFSVVVGSCAVQGVHSMALGLPHLLHTNSDDKDNLKVVITNASVTKVVQVVNVTVI